MRNIHISIGIPAYNEGKNIDKLLRALERQYLWGITLDAIIIISDGSTDDTVERIKSVINNKICLINHENRHGINATLNEIFNLSKSPILVILNADVDLSSGSFLHEITHPFSLQPNLGIVGANVQPLRPKSFFEKTLYISHLLKKDIYDHLNEGVNIYNCHGRGRAIAKRLYDGIKIPENCPEDSYMYLTCISEGLKFNYQRDAIVRFRSPQNLSDHIKQSIRFTKGKSSLKSYFNSRMIDSEYHLSLKMIITSLLRYSLRYPIHVLAYLIIQSIIHVRYEKIFIDQTLFEPAESSKGLI